MIITRVIPCLLLKGEGLVKTVKFKDPKYVGDPINAVKIFNDKEVDELIFLDITATPENRRPNFKLIEHIAEEAFMPLGYGGGIRCVEDARTLFNIGVEKVIINSSAFENSALIRQLANTFGSQSVVVSIDTKKNLLGKYEVFVNSGKTNTHLDPVKYARQVYELGAGEVFVNSIDKDGTMLGYDIPLIQKISANLDIPLIACGGAGKLNDLKEVVLHGGASAVSAGSLFVFYGKHRAVLINYPSRDEITNLFELK